jgi:hypothetical protein
MNMRDIIIYQMLNIYINKVIILLLLVVTSSCGRYYQKEYLYTPPTEPAERECVLSCRNNLQQCENSVNKAYQECLRNIEQTSMLNYSIDLNSNKISKTSNNRNTLEQCHSYNNHTKCQSAYNACYINCGGKVESNNYSIVNIN